MPTLAQLEYLLAVQTEGHFARAARLCGVSQPTLSAQVRKAEETLGAVLFDRGAHPIQPTDAGRAVLRQAAEVIAAHRALVELAAGSFQEVAGPFALGIIPTLAPYVVPWFIERFAAEYPQVALTIHERPTDGILDALERRTLDAGLLATPLGEAGLVERVLFHDPFYVYAHPDEPLLQGVEVAATDLDRGRLWLLDDGHCVRNQVVSLCGSGVGGPGPVRFAAGSFETLRSVIDTLGGYTLVPETYARTLPRTVQRLRVCALAEPTPTREVSLVLPRRSTRISVADALERVLRGSIPRALRHEPDTLEVLPVRT